MTDLKAEARRLAEEVHIAIFRAEGITPRNLVIESALLTFGRLVREEDAKVCDGEPNKYAAVAAILRLLKALE